MIYASILWIGLSSLFGCLLALLAGELKPWISLVSLFGALAVSIWAYRRRSSPTKEVPDKTLSLPIGLSYFVIVMGIYFHSVFLFFRKDGSFWIQNPFNLGDMSFHWGTIRYLAKGAHFWPENPIFFGHRFRYPFGMDFFNAFFENLHVPISAHLPLVTLACLLMSLYLLHAVGGPLLVYAVFFSGGFFNFWQPVSWDVLQLQSGLDFKNIFLSVLLTQRGFLYALPAVLLLYQTLQKTFTGVRVLTMAEKLGYGVIWGALGFFHLHSFFLISLCFGLWILWRRQWRQWGLTVILAAVLGFPFVVNALWPSADTFSLVHWSRGWARPETTGIFVYWMQNLGPWLVALVAALIVFYRRKAWGVFIPLAFVGALFVLFAHLILAPWDWDNIKLIFWCYLLALILMSDWLWTSRKPAMKALVFVVFFGPGFLLFVHSLPLYTHGIVWTSEKEINKAEVLLAGQDENLGLVIAPEYEHPALLLGHKLYMGYTGHVWSHGYNYGAREALLNRYFSGDESVVADFAREQVQLIYQGPFEIRRESGWKPAKGLRKVGQALDHELYQIE
jgi:hypothetical protein